MKFRLDVCITRMIFSAALSMSVMYAMDQGHPQHPLCKARAALYLPAGQQTSKSVEAETSVYPVSLIITHYYGTAVAFSPTQMLVAAGIVLVEKHKHYPYLVLFDAQTGKQRHCLASTAQGLTNQADAQWNDADRDQNAPTSITCIQYADDGKEVALGRRDGKVYVYDSECMSLLRACACQGEISSLAWQMDYENNISRLIIGSAKRRADVSQYATGCVSILQQKKEHEFSTHNCTYPRVCALPDETIAVVEGGGAGLSERLIHIYDYKGQKVTALERTSGGRFIFKDIAYNPRTQTMVGAGIPLANGQESMYIFEPTPQGKDLHLWWQSVKGFGWPHTSYRQYEGLKIAMNGAGTTLAVVNPSEGSNCWGTVDIYDVQSCTHLHTHDIHYVSQAALSADGTLLATVDVNGISIWPAVGASMLVASDDDDEDEGVTF